MAAPYRRYGSYPKGPPTPPRRPLTGGTGTFATGAEVKVPPEAALLVIWNSGFSATVQGRYRAAGTLTSVKSGSVYIAYAFSGSLFEGVVPSAADSKVAWEIIPDGIVPFRGQPAVVPVASSTVVGPDAFGAPQNPGVAATFSRGDHDHGLPSLPADVAYTDVAQTFSAEQTFGVNPEILGSSTGGTVLASAEAGATDHTQTFQAKTGTVADLSDIPATPTYAHPGPHNIAKTITWTTPAGGKMLGLGGTITPTATGTVIITISGWFAMPAVSGDQSDILDIRTGTGTAPNNGDAVTGTAAGSNGSEIHVGTVAGAEQLTIPFSLTVTVTGLSLNVAHWIDAVGLNTGSVTAVTVHVTLQADEVP